jgi:hypothetical protein
MKGFLKYSCLFYFYPIYSLFQLFVISNNFSDNLFTEFIVSSTCLALVIIVGHGIPEKLALRALVDHSKNLTDYLYKIAQASFLLSLIFSLIIYLSLRTIYKYNDLILLFTLNYGINIAYISLSLSISRISEKYSHTILIFILFFSPALLINLLFLISKISQDQYLLLLIITSFCLNLYASINLRAYYNFDLKILLFKGIYIIPLIISAGLGWAITFALVLLTENGLSNDSFKDFAVALRFSNILGLALSLFVSYFQKNIITSTNNSNNINIFYLFILSYFTISAFIVFLYGNYHHLFDVEKDLNLLIILTINIAIGTFIGYFINPLMLKKLDYSFYCWIMGLTLVLLILIGPWIIDVAGSYGVAYNYIGVQALLLILLSIRLFVKK